MSEPTAVLPSKGVPLAAVVYVVRFDPKGRPLRTSAFHIETSGATHLDGCASTALEPLLTATRCSMKAVVGQTMQEALSEHQTRGLLGPEATCAKQPATSEPLPAAGEIF